MMTKIERNQARRDIERLRKAAERIENGQDALDDALERLDIAIQGLQVIATWAKSTGAPSDIYMRAIDTLALIDKEEINNNNDLKNHVQDKMDTKRLHENWESQIDIGLLP